MIQARDGRLYGTGSDGITVCNPICRIDFGSVFRVEGNGTLTVLHQFDADSASPVAELVEIDDGSLYGTSNGRLSSTVPPQSLTHGTIFRVDPATGAFTTRYRFSGPDGSTPVAPLIQGTDGLIYGTTSAGGAYGFGTVFSLDSAGTLTTLHHFAGADGANPNAGVLQGLDGRLYGTTTNGGAFGYGTVFVMNVTGGLTTLHDFALSDGANPVNELIQANDGAFYGAAPAGGPTGGGVIFRVRLATSPPDQYVEIVSRNSGQCLDVSWRLDRAGRVRHPVDLPWRAESTVAAGAGRRRRVSDHRAPQRTSARRLWRVSRRRHAHHSVAGAWWRQPGVDARARARRLYAHRRAPQRQGDGRRIRLGRRWRACDSVHASRRRKSAVAPPRGRNESTMTFTLLARRFVRLAIVASRLS